MGDSMATPPQDLEVFARLARSGSLGARVVAALLRRILEIQDEAEEAEVLALVARVEALLRE